MLPIRCFRLPLLGALGLVLATPALSADPTLGEAVKKADAKYLEVPETGIADGSPKIVVGGGEEGLSPLDEEISSGPLRVTLTYVEEEPEEAQEAPPDDMPGEAGEPPAEAGEMPAEAPPTEDAPEDGLPPEAGLGETVLRAPVVTVYFTDPNSKADTGPAAAPDDQPADEAAPGAPAKTEGQTAPGEASTEAETADAQEPAGPRVVAKLEGDSAGFSDPPVSVQIAELDPNNPYPEVVVSFFTGGAHCCSVTSVVTSNADGSEWKEVDVGEFDGGPMVAVDLDGNGAYEFETRDNAFLYAFACYACSEAPLQVLALQDGAMKDVSADPRFKAAHAAWLKSMIVGVPEADVNGFLAGYVGQKIRVGEGKQAWDLMLKYYDRASDWGLELCDQDLDENGECPGKTTKVTFPQALERMLKENGYMVEN
jgi:hypothetical protein